MIYLHFVQMDRNNTMRNKRRYNKKTPLPLLSPKTPDHDTYSKTPYLQRDP